MSKTSATYLVDLILRSRPEDLAYVGEDGTLTYNELINRALAHAKLRMSEANTLGKDPQRRPIIVHGRNSCGMLIGILAAVFGGFPFVPLPETLPKERVDKIYSLLEQEYGEQSVLYTKADDFLAHAVIREDTVTCGEPSSHGCMYIMFTSGSTGEPKGIKISYDNVLGFVQWMKRTHSWSRSKETFLNQAPWSFDLSVIELWVGLATGSTIVSLSPTITQHPSRLQDAAVHNPTVWVSTPSFFQFCLSIKMFDDRLFRTIKKFLFCGEKLSKDLVRKLWDRFPHAEVYNMYGPTETTCAVTSIQILPMDLLVDEDLPVGYRMPGNVITVNDDGTLRITGVSVGLGYLDRAAEGFGTSQNGRYFDTGDLGKVTEDGLIYIQGRKERGKQVKIRGNRVELEEIGRHLNAVKGVAFGVIAFDEGRERLSAHIWGTDTSGEFLGFVRQTLMSKLPDYMVPNRLVVRHINDAPLTTNGKLDKIEMKRMAETYGIDSI